MKSFLILAGVAVLAGVARGGPMDAVERDFKELPMEARRLTGPLFWLHGDESKERLELFVEKTAEGGNGSFTAESRPHNDWLGPNWYRDLGICLDAAKKHDLKMWIFDEKWWPSQGIGGKVPEEYSAKRLEASAVDVDGPRAFDGEGYGGDRYVATITGRLAADGKIDGNSLVDLAPQIRDGKLSWQVPSGKWRVMKFTHTQAPGLGQGGGRQLSVDGASKGCVDWFIKTVYQPHLDHFGADFGKTIPGFFYDEPETRGDWGTELNVVLKEWGVDWKKAYVAHKFELSGEDQIAAGYQYREAFADAWGRTMYGGMSEWCRKHSVVSMGHFMEHGYLYLNPDFCAGDMMRLQRYSDMGGIDLVCQQMYPGQRPHSIYQTPKLGSSISHVFGKTDDVTMCEMFGAYGQNITYPQMKWLTDQMQVRGVNFMIPHSFNPRAPYDTDCPPYFLMDEFEPRWPLYRVYADYTSRLSLMLSGGRHVCPIALLFSGNTKQVGKMVTPEDMTSAIQDAQYDCDWLPFDVFESTAKLAGKDIQLHNERYQVLIVPPAEVVTHGTLAKARAFFESGGIVIGYGFLPSKSATIGKTAADIAALRQAVWGDASEPTQTVCRQNDAGGRSYFLPERPTAKQIAAALKDAGVPPVVEVLEGDTGGWLHVLHRVKADSDVFLICNQNHTGDARKFRFNVVADGEPECWDAMRNEISAVPSKRNGKNAEVELTLEPSESVMLVFQPQKRGLPMRLTDQARSNGDPIPVHNNRPPAEKTPEAKLVVVKATYGVPGDTKRSRDVRERLQKLIDAGQHQIQVAVLAEGDDPALNVVKTLDAECTAGDQKIKLKGKDPQTISLSGRTSELNQKLNSIAAGRRFTAGPVEADPFDGTCDIPAGVDLAASRIHLELTGLKPEAAARVTVNGQYAGGFIDKPFRLDVTKHIKAGSNSIRIEPFGPETATLVIHDGGSK